VSTSINVESDSARQERKPEFRVFATPQKLWPQANAQLGAQTRVSGFRSWPTASTEREFADQHNFERERDRSDPRDREAAREITIAGAGAIRTAVMAAIVTDGYISRRGSAASEPEPRACSLELLN